MIKYILLDEITHKLVYDTENLIPHIFSSEELSRNSCISFKS